MGLGAVAAVGLTLAACGPPAQGSDRDDAREAPPLEVVEGPLVSQLLLTGAVEAADSIALVAPNVNIHPLQVRWLVEDGTRVEAGDTIVELDNTSLLTELENLESQIDQRETELEVAVAQATASVAQAEFALLSAETASKKAAVSAQIPEELTSALEYANLQLALDKAELEESEARRALATARANAEADVELKRIAYERALRDQARVTQRIEQLELVAPRTGLVILQENRQEDRVFQAGDTTHAGNTIAQLPDLASLRVAAQLYDVDDGRVEPGMPAEVVLDAFPEETLDGTVLRVDNLARQASRRSRRRIFSVVVEVPDLDRDRALPGMSARLRIERTSGDGGSTLVPRSAIGWDDGPFAVTRDGTRHALTVRDCNGTHCLVESALEVGDRLRSPSAEEAGP